ncbi:unnamed protein product [Sphagnum compactum]
MSNRMRGKQSTVEDEEEEELDLVIPKPDLVGREKSVVSFSGKTFSFPVMDQSERWQKLKDTWSRQRRWGFPVTATLILNELCVEDSQTFKKSEYDFIKDEYHRMKARVEDADMVLNQLEEYDRIKMELIALRTEVMVYRQKIKSEKAD